MANRKVNLLKYYKIKADGVISGPFIPQTTSSNHTG